jgi:hypothetical protein
MLMEKAENTSVTKEECDNSDKPVYSVISAGPDY